MKKVLYNTPELEIIEFVTEDVIDASGGGEVDAPEAIEGSHPTLPWD